MLYPTGKSTKGRTLICMNDHEEFMNKLEEDSTDVMHDVDCWLEENDYCVEKWQLKEYLESCGCPSNVIKEMEGGSADGGSFASLDSTPGMGNPSLPSGDGTNAGFYDVNNVGSGDRFTTLTAGTPAGKKKKKKELSMITDFAAFKDSMKKSQ